MDGIDIFGLALQDYHNGDYSEDIVVHSSIAEDDIIPIPYLFRSFEEMPVIEQKALTHARGAILDIGFGAGSHLKWLQENGKDAAGIDISKGAVTLSRKRNLRNTTQENILNHQGSYDTLLLLMNGTGIFEKVSKVKEYLNHLKSLLVKDGQILIDSSDIKYMFEDEDGGLWIDMHRDYYGEVTYAMSYKGQKAESFDWLYLDFELLKYYAQRSGLRCELLAQGDHHEYLARLTVA